MALTKKYQITTLSFFNLWVVLAHFVGDLSQREKLSKIKPPLTLFTKKVLMISYHAEFDKIYFRYQIIHQTIYQKKVKKKMKRSHYFNPCQKNCSSNRATLCTVNRQGTQLFLSNGQSTLHLRYLTFLVVTFNAA